MSEADSTNDQLESATRSDTNARSGTIDPTRSTRPAGLDGHIDLTDNTGASEEVRDAPLHNDEDDDLADLSTKSRTSRRPSARIKQEITKRKYAKYAGPKESTSGAQNEDSVWNSTAEQTQGEEHGMERLKKTPTDKESHLRRGQQKVIGMLNYRRKQQVDAEGDTVIDVLYENQRGSWFFGKPLFSSNSLLNFDAAAWEDSIHHPSAVDTTNAQLPDPSWHWCWHRWYVDMSPDVDEQGWQYSFMFQNKFLWHGTHPWFHSFVRRRRWVRKRARGGVISVDDDADGLKKTQTGAHTRRLGADYFSVRAPQPGGPPPSFAETARSGFQKSDQDDLEEFHDVQALLRKLKKLALDREKISAIIEYVEKSGESLHDLADEIPHVMSMFMFQHSRRHLLTRLLNIYDKRLSHEKEHAADKGKENATAYDQENNDLEHRRTGYLKHVLEVADQELKRMEYWSDLVDIAKEGNGLGTAEAIVEPPPPVNMKNERQEKHDETH